MATDGNHVYVSDTGTGKLHRLRGEEVAVLQGPEGANGITFSNGKMYALGLTAHDVYELDPSGKGKPKPFGLGEHFKGPDGIEVLDDGSFLVSDVWGHTLSWVGADRETVRLLAKHECVADIGLDRERNLLFLPLFWESVVVVYKLEKAALAETGSGPTRADQ